MEKTKHRNGQTVPTEWHNKAIRALEDDFGRELNLDEKVAICANSRKAVRDHYRQETGQAPPF